jgi:hypothetical protein
MLLAGLLLTGISYRITKKLGSSGKIMTRRTKEKEGVHARLLDGLRLLLSSWLSPTQRYIGEICNPSNYKQKVEMPITSMDGLAIAGINHRMTLTLGYSIQRCVSDIR